MSRRGKLLVFRTPAKVSGVSTDLTIQQTNHRAIVFHNVKLFELEDGFFKCELEDGRKICTNQRMLLIESAERAKAK